MLGKFLARMKEEFVPFVVDRQYSATSTNENIILFVFVLLKAVVSAGSSGHWFYTKKFSTGLGQYIRPLF